MREEHLHAIGSAKLLTALESFRVALVRSGVLVAVFSIGGYLAAGMIIRFLQRLTGVRLVAYGLPDTFFAFLKLVLAVGLLATVPHLLYSILLPLPAKYPTLRRRSMFVFWLAAIGLFYTGAAFSVMVSLPYGAQYLLSFESQNIVALISVKKFISFCLLIVFGFGMIFELPLFMMLLSRIGLVGATTLSRYRRYAILVISIVAAILTPTPDMVNMALLAVPLYLLFELGLLGMRLWKQ